MLLTTVLHTFEGGPKKRENAGDASRRVRKTRKTTILCLVTEPSLAQDWLRMLKVFRYISATMPILNVNQFFGSGRGITGMLKQFFRSAWGITGGGLDDTGTVVTSDTPGRTLKCFGWGEKWFNRGSFLRPKPVLGSRNNHLARLKNSAKCKRKPLLVS